MSKTKTGNIEKFVKKYILFVKRCHPKQNRNLGLSPVPLQKGVENEFVTPENENAGASLRALSKKGAQARAEVLFSD